MVPAQLPKAYDLRVISTWYLGLMLGFKPLDRMWERIEIGRSDSDSTFFHDLMYAAEMTAKLIVAALVAAVDDDKDRSRFRQVSLLVRADGLGEWASALTEVLTGPPSQHLLAEARTEQRELTQKFGPDGWQHQAAHLLHSCLTLVDPGCEPPPAKVDGLRCIRDLVRLRNKTRGHGAPKAEVLSTISPTLEQALRLFTEHFSLFKREWAYLHRNLSGKYRITSLSKTTVAFDPLKQNTNARLPDGVYLHLGQPVRIELAQSDADISDFYLANGGFNEKRFEMLSYITGSTTFADAAPYLSPTTPLPGSETEGLGELDIVGNCVSNLPAAPTEYIPRELLENELLDVLRNDRHPVITLVGRGGIGKTSLALTALHAIAQETRFDALLWFSARDLDLLPEGPKQVRPAVLTVKDVADEFVRLTTPGAAKEKGFKATEYLAESLTKGTLGATLFVFDNFETVVNPTELFKWIDTYVRSPNKVLVTTRHRDFKGDYPIDVRGMSEAECNLLINATAVKLGIQHLLTADYRRELVHESEGHPYVVKILLGEVAKAGKLKKVERIVADADELLTALFERTYALLTPVAQRVFLTLCNWRTTIPKLALEAVLLRPANEKMAVSDAIDELERSSFIELVESQADHQMFVSTPLVAALFGRRKLAVSPMKSAIEADTVILHQFGAGQRSDVRHGVAPRIERLITSIARRALQDKQALDEYLPMLEFIARHYQTTWLKIASLYEDIGTPDALEHAKQALRRHLEGESGGDAAESWRRLAIICHRTGDLLGELHALVELAVHSSAEFDEISNAANKLNSLLVQNRAALESEEKQILVHRLVAAMEARSQEADATAMSRLAWLYLHLKNAPKAQEYVRRGLELDANNEHCQRLAERLRPSPGSN